ncbi:hypothetical protein MMC20_000422 [Loxospora ochrophaea]|nr:hypothetical protein [Loxospora ochrophaea]
MSTSPIHVEIHNGDTAKSDSDVSIRLNDIPLNDILWGPEFSQVNENPPEETKNEESDEHESETDQWSNQIELWNQKWEAGDNAVYRYPKTQQVDDLKELVRQLPSFKNPTAFLKNQLSGDSLAKAETLTLFDCAEKLKARAKIPENKPLSNLEYSSLAFNYLREEE